MPTIRLLTRPASIAREFPAEQHALYAAVSEAGHAFLYAPQPGQWWPVVWVERPTRLDGVPAIQAKTPVVLDNVYIAVSYTHLTLPTKA